MEKAIYIGGLRFNECAPVFELNQEGTDFVMLGDASFNYPKETVYEDDDFFIFTVKDGIVSLKNKKINKKG